MNIHTLNWIVFITLRFPYLTAKGDDFKINVDLTKSRIKQFGHIASLYCLYFEDTY